MKVALNVGHSQAHQGAGAGGVTEFTYNADLARQVRRVGVFFQHSDLSEVIHRINEWGPDLVVSLHLNSLSDPNVDGGAQYIYPGSEGGRRAAEHIGPVVQHALGIRDRGVIDATIERMGRRISILSDITAPVVLLEPGFVSNPSDRGKLVANKRDYALALSDALEAL